MTPEEVLVDIQRAYYLHPDDIKWRAKHPNDPRTKRELESIKRLEGVLDLVSKQLYTDITHFILELIQNADDNSYSDSVNPTLKLSLCRHELIVKCNEVGFTEANVRALCDINKSTKKGLKQGIDASIGEKGIGFKSVFSIADEVSVYSNDFKFTLNVNRNLGMLCPTVAEEDYSEEGWTVIVLRLNVTEDDYFLVKESLEQLDPQMLLFTRRLQELEVSTLSKGEKSEDDNCCQVVDYSNTYKLQLSISHEVKIATILGAGSTKYFVCRHEVNDMPPHSSRPDVSTAEIVVAFPFDETKGPIVNQQHIFAYLPLRISPFPFLIQADWVVQTSREGIREQEAWNIRLRDEIATCFVAAMLVMKKFDYLSKTFLRYVPTNFQSISHDKFLAPVADRILKALQKLPIIRTFSGKWVKPGRALIVPAEFAPNKEPLVSAELVSREAGSRFDFASFNNGRELLAKLGCQRLKVDWIYKVFARSSPADLGGFQFIQNLFHYLQTATNAQPEARNLATSAKVLLVSDGKWISVHSARSQRSQIYLGSNTSANEQLEGMTYKLLDDEFYKVMSKDLCARLFITDTLGLTPLDSHDVIEEIIRFHECYLPSKHAGSVFISHAKYLRSRESSISPQQKQRMKFSLRLVDQRNVVCSSNTVVLDWSSTAEGLPNGTTLSKACGSADVSFLNNRYDQDDIKFLRNFTQIQSRIPIYQSGYSIYLQTLSAKNQKNNILLHYLRDTLTPYRLTKAESALCLTLRSQTFLCENGKYVELSSTYLRTSTMVSLLTPNMDVLDLGGTQDPHAWKFLADMGVTVQPKLSLFVKQLQYYKSGTSREEVQNFKGLLDKLYTGLVSHILATPESQRTSVVVSLKDIFDKEALLFVTHDKEKIWAKRDQIYAHCPMFVKYTVRAMSSESGIFTTLSGFLDLPKWETAKHLYKELEFGVPSLMEAGVKMDVIQDYIFRALKSIQSALPADCKVPPEWVSKIFTLPIFPITSPNGITRPGQLGDDTLVPDSVILNEHFKGKVKLLDFGQKNLWDILPLFKSVRPGLGFISTYDDPTLTSVKVGGPTRDDIATTKLIGARRLALLRLLLGKSKTEVEELEKIHEKLKNIKVVRCHRLEQVISVPRHGIYKIQLRESHIVHDSQSATIHIIRNNLPATLNCQLSQHLSEYLDVSDLMSQIHSLLMQPVQALDTLFKDVFKLPDLPQLEWLETRTAENERLTTDIRQTPKPVQSGLSAGKVQEIKHRIDTMPLPNLKRETIEISDDDDAPHHGVSPKRPRLNSPTDFKREIPTGTSAYHQPNFYDILDDSDEHFSHSPMSSRRSTPESDLGSFAQSAVDLTPRSSSATRDLSISPIPIIPNRHSTPVSRPTPSANRVTASANRDRPSVKREMRHSMSLRPRAKSQVGKSTATPSPAAGGFGVVDVVRRLRSRPKFTTALETIFAREYFVFKYLEAHLTEFTEVNWTSAMREYVFSPCEDGPSTFSYNGDIGALFGLFKCDSNGETYEGKNAYIYVMQFGKGSQCCQLNGKQFDQMQQSHRSGDLFMLIFVDGDSLNPRISEVMVNPFNMWAKVKLDFHTEKLVIGPSDVAGS